MGLFSIVSISLPVDLLVCWMYFIDDFDFIYTSFRDFFKELQPPLLLNSELRTQI